MTVPPPDRRPALRPPQFGLSTLLWVVACLCAILAAMNLVGPIGAFALTLFILSVIAHVSGAALGTQLRSFGDQPVDDEDRPLDRKPQYQRGVAVRGVPSRLGERRRLGILLAVIVVLMISLGAGGGAWWTLNASPTPPMQDVLLAAAAYGVLGGIWGFIAGGFVMVGVSAWKQALRSANSANEPQ